MTPQQFINKWREVTLSERSACQQHFLDLCELLGQPKPAEADPDGAWYTFERGVNKTGGGAGWADVWMRNHFGWEYKGKHKDLAKAYEQLLRYREDLENPPLLVVCDMDRFEVHTNFTGTIKKVHAFDLDSLADPINLDVLRKVFTDPQELKPGQTTAAITEQAARQFGVLADGMRVRGIEPHRAAHFLMKLMFCMFAEDIGLLGPKGDRLFTRTLAGAKSDPPRLATVLKSLFDAMSHGGHFGADEIAYFNGGLFADADVVELTGQEIRTLAQINEFDWANVEPSIFGTLFERTLDPAKRSQIGAHYTSREDIETLLLPVMMAPLRREWDAVRARCDSLFEKVKTEAAKARKAGKQQRKDSKPFRDLTKLVREFLDRLAHVRVLDPACGSGNFLYVALHLLLNLEKEVISYVGPLGLGVFPQVRPTQLSGIEINPYAQELAQVVIWIGYLQWMHHNGFAAPRNPVLDPIDTIECRDAILDLSDPEHPKEPDWPEAEFIVGNPPFLGGNRIRAEMGDEYIDALFQLYEGRIPAFSDLCCYWFEKSRDQLSLAKCRRAGLLATQGIRGGANREVLKRIKKTGDIFWAISDRDWILDGATVHVSMVGFGNQQEQGKILDGTEVRRINSNLTAAADVTVAKTLRANRALCFMGPSAKAPFDIDFNIAREMLSAPRNINGSCNSDVVRPVKSAIDIGQYPRNKWTLYFATLQLDDASKYEMAFEFVRNNILPVRQSRRDDYRGQWWQYARPRIEMNHALRPCIRFIATPAVSKHRILIWCDRHIVCNQGTLVFAFDDDCSFGVLHSRPHEVWARSQGTQLRERESGFRYTPTTCFETFPFPEPTEDQRDAIAAAAKELDTLRNNWLNPPEWTTTQILEFPGTVGGPWDRYIDPAAAKPLASDPGVKIGTVKYPRLVPNSEEAATQLKKRTLTNLYNQRPTWLDLAHRKLDEAVFAAYGWDPSINNEVLLAKLLELNLQRAGN